MTTIVLAVALFALIHSFLAGQDVKQKVQEIIGDRAYYGLYRIVYNVFAVITLAPASWFLFQQPSETIWQVEGFPALLMMAVQFIGVIGLCFALMQGNPGRFAGIEQLSAYLNSRTLPLPPEPLQIGGLYGVVRHPLYLFSLLGMWFSPIMTITLLAFNLAATLYFVAGSLVEEKRLVKAFGEPYREYRQRVPWIIPFLRINHT